MYALCKHNSRQVCLTHKTDFFLSPFALEGYTKAATVPPDLLLNLLTNVIDPKIQDCLVPAMKINCGLFKLFFQIRSLYLLSYAWYFLLCHNYVID